VNNQFLSKWATVALEATLLILLTVSWIGGWIATRSTLNALAPGTRNVLLGFWSSKPYLWVVPILVAVTLLLVVLRYRWPLATYGAGWVVLLYYALTFPMVGANEFGSSVAFMILAFWAARSAKHIWPIAITAVTGVSLASVPLYNVQENLATTGQIQTPGLASFTATIGQVLLICMAVGAGWLVRRLLAQTGELSEQNRELELRRVQAAQAAVNDERLRISRELHDVVAHHISAMTVHAGGAQRAMATNTEAAHASLDQIAKSGRSAIAELQRMLGFLRGNEIVRDPARSPAPSLRHLAWLAESFGDLSVDIETSGDETSGDIQSLPASVDLSAYRIVQEALTNVVKHSNTPTAQVQVAINGDTTSVSIVNSDPGTTPVLAVNGTGHGLIGMKERVALHQGTLSSGPDPAGGWKVHAVLNHGGVDA